MKPSADTSSPSAPAPQQPRRFVVATGTRADWGLLSPLARRLADTPGVEVVIAATNMHLRQDMGMTVSEIEDDGFKPLCIPTSGTKPEIVAQTVTGFSSLFREVDADAVIILGDRFEMLGVATAALLCGTPIVHIAGGALSLGAFDDAIRHSISKMAVLHLVETEEYRRRVVQMGEDPDHVVTTGAIGVDSMINQPHLSRHEMESQLGIPLSDHSILVTLHPATLDPLSPTEQMQQLLDALDRFPRLNVLFTYPNNDTDPEPLIAMLRDYERRNPRRVKVYPSLGRLRYHSALQYVDAVVGNSSSGLVEVPSAHKPTLDIGIRQEGRTRGDSVVHCDCNADDIERGLKKVLSSDMKLRALKCVNPYYQPDTLGLMADAILSFPFTPYPRKTFHDL